MSKVLAVIPARGGSKSIPHKNILPLMGKPLIAWTIEAALASEVLDRVIVSTDDAEIARVSRECGAEVPFLRPPTLAQDETPTLPVLQHAVRWLKENENYQADWIVTLQPTSPMRGAQHIDDALKLLGTTSADSMTSVCLAEHSPYWMYRIEEEKLVALLPEQAKFTRRQDLPAVYRLNGALYVTRVDILMEQNSILGKVIRPFVMAQESSVDIDTLFDFKLAELLLKELQDAND